MAEGLISARPLPDYRLELTFGNGSKATVNMSQRVRTVRFSRLAAPELFATARAVGEKVVWSDDCGSISVWCSELLESMLLD
jgi:hypothetical protein